MPLTVLENTYASEADATTYCTTYGLDPLTDAETSLVRATTAIDRLYGGRFIGQKTGIDQPLQWPRSSSTTNFNYPNYAGPGTFAFGYTYDTFGNVRDLSGAPKELVEATIELAVLLEADAVDPYAQPDPLIKSKTEKIDVISEQIEYQPGLPYRLEPLHKITTILAPLLYARGQVRLVRG